MASGVPNLFLIGRRRSWYSCSVGLSDRRSVRRPTPDYNMDLHDITPGARQRATADQGSLYSSLLAQGSLGTAAASRVRATAGPGAPPVLMSTPAAFTQQLHGEGGEALSRPPASHNSLQGQLTQALIGCAGASRRMINRLMAKI